MSNLKISLFAIWWLPLSYLALFAQELLKERMYTAALIEMAANYEAAKSQKICDAEKIVVALSQCKKRSA